MTTAAEIVKRVNRGYTDVFLKRRYPDGSFDATWLDITRFVLRSGLQRIRYKLDSDDYDIGLFVTDNVTMTFNNRAGKFNDPSDARSLWAGFETRHFSKIKIQAGYIDSTDTKIPEVAFEGLFDERSVTIDDMDQVQATILSREAVFRSVTVPAGSLASGVLASEAIFILCTRAEVTDHVTIAQANLVPANDVVLDAPSAFNTRKLDEVLSEIMLVTGSVMFIDSSGALQVRNRQQSARIMWSFYLNSESGQRDNVYRMTGINSGRQRVKNYWVWGSTALVASSEDYHLERYGTTKRTVSSSAVTNALTKQAILDALLAEWQFPKRELVLETDYLANELSFFDLVTLDVRPTLTPESPRALCGSSVCGAASTICSDYVNGLRIEPNIGWKVLSIEHDLQQFRTILKLREKGTLLNDGYLPMVISKTYSVAFAGDTSKDIDTSAEDIHAARAIVQVVDSSGDLPTVDILVTRPGTHLLRLTAGAATTATFSVLVIEVDA